MAKRRARSQTERRERRRKARQENDERKKKSFRLLGAAVIIFAMLIGASVGAYYYILKDIKEQRPEIRAVDAVGTKGDPSVNEVTSVKISIKNKGGGSFDMKDLSVHWRGPGADARVFFNDASYADGTKDSFGTGGVGSVKDGWDPSSGKFLVQKGTVAWVVINLTVSGGISDTLGPKDTFTVTFSVQDGGQVNEGTADFSVPGDISAGKFVVMDKK